MAHSNFVKTIRVVRTVEEARALDAELLSQPLSAMTAVDTEWYDFDKDKTNINNGLVFCMTVSWRAPGGAMRCAYVHNHGSCEGLVHELQPFLESEHMKTAHNAAVDVHALTNEGLRVNGMLYDTMVMDHALDENRENAHGLKECAYDLLGHDRVPYNRTFGSPKLRKDGKPMASGQLIVPSLPEYTMGTDPPSLAEALAGKTEAARRWAVLYEYSVADTYDGLLLFEHYAARLKKLPWINGKTMYDFFMSEHSHFIGLLTRMERRGMYVDKKFLQEMEEVAKKDIAQIETELSDWAEAPINPASRKQLAQLFYGKGVYPVMKGKKVLYNIKGRGWPVLRLTDGGKSGKKEPSTKAEHLLELEIQLEKMGKKEDELAGIRLALRHSKRTKQLGTYLEGLQRQAIGNRVHGRLNPIGTTSGRLSASNPNLQNISTGEKDVYHLRDCFRAPPGMLLIVADYSQLEYRLLAHLSQEPKLIELFHQDYDLHSLTTYNVFSDVRQEADEKFGGVNAESLKWIAHEFGDQRKKAKCVHPDTLVETDDGVQPIGLVVGAGLDDTFTKPLAKTVQGRKGSLRLNSTYRGGEKELFVVCTRHNLVVSTGEHKFMTSEGTWIRARDLKPGTVLREAAAPMKLAFRAPKTVAGKLWEGIPEVLVSTSPDLAYFAGAFHGDGTSNGTNAAITHGPVADPVYAAWQSQLVSLVEGLGLKATRGDSTVYLGSRVTCRWLSLLGLHQEAGKRKKMSVPVWAMNEELFPHYFAGLVDTDGTVGKDGRISVTTKWPTFAGQLGALLQGLGCRVSIEPTWNRTYERYYYRVHVAKADGVRFRPLLRLEHKRSRVRGSERVVAMRENAVIRVIPHGTGACVDLNVETHEYYANNLVSHNTLNFEIIYGVGYRKLADQLRISEEAAESMINGWFSGYPYVKAWMERTLNACRNQGFLRTLGGRYRRAVKSRLLSSDRGLRGAEERTLVNSGIQGSAADVVQKAMLNIDRCRALHDLGMTQILQVHDEIVAEVPRENAYKAVEIMRPLMERPFTQSLRVPLPASIGIGPTWATAKV